MDFEHYFQIWESSRRQHEMPQVRERLESAIAAVPGADEEAVAWLKAAIKDEEKKLFAAYILRQAPTFPNELFTPLLRAAIEELNPTVCRSFVDPCIHAYGQRRVIEALLTCVKGGTDYEKAGAVNALHWTYTERGVIDSSEGYGTAMDTTLVDVLDRKRVLFLQTFVQCKDINVRRSLIAQLELEPSLYPEHLKGLIEKAVKIARTHTDEYIRHRVEVQLGLARSVYPLPQRKRITSQPGLQVQPPQPQIPQERQSSKSGWWKKLFK